MSRAGFTANKALFRVIGGRRATVETDEAYNAKSRCHVLPLPDARHRKAFLRDLVPDRAAAIDSGARVFRARVSHHAIPSFEHQIVSCVMPSGR